MERCRAALRSGPGSGELWGEWRGGGERRETPRALKLSRLTVRCSILPDAEIRERRVKCFITGRVRATPYAGGLNVRDVDTTYGVDFKLDVRAHERAGWHAATLPS